MTTKRAKKTTRGNGFYLLVFAAAFIVLLTYFVTNGLKPVTETRIADCQDKITVLSGDLEYAQNRNATEEEITLIEGRIKTYTDRITMLENRAVYYNITMAVLVAVLVVCSVALSLSKTSFTRPVAANSSQTRKMEYYPMIAAPITAVVLLLAIGASYRTIFAWTLFDLLMVVAAVVVMFTVFLLYRRIPYVSARMALRPAYKKNGVIITKDDILFLVPAAGMALLLLINVLFGVTVNGAKLWVNFFGVQMQPGEFVKVLAIILCATAYGSMWRAITAAGVCFLAALVMVWLRDMGGAIVIVAMLMVMLFLMLDNKKTFSLMENRKLVILVLILAVSLFGILLSLFPYAMERFGNWGKAIGEGGQQAEMLKALAFAGVGGLGLENSSYILNIFAIESDMAIAGLTSVFGIGMLAIVLLCYAVFILLPIRRYAIYRSFYFLSAQVAVVMLVQILLNALGSLDLLPFTGVVAPFLSDGGSALISFSAMVGLILATLHPVIEPLEVTP